MRINPNGPTVTKKYHIEVPTHQFGSTVAAVYRVWFGKHYFIWKGKYLLQSASQLAESIERYIRLEKNEPESYLLHICNHITKTRCMKATIEVVEAGFIKEGTASSINCYEILRAEQKLLKKAKNDTYCLNNNEQAYISKWMEEGCPDDVQRFLKSWNK